MSEQLRKWIADYDCGNTMESVSMGGISDSYEAGIQDCAIQTMRNLQMITLPEDEEAFGVAVEVAANAAVELLNKKYGFSGAQVGAAKNMAAVFWKQTPEKGIEMMKKQDPERIIKIRKAADGSVWVDRFSVRNFEIQKLMKDIIKKLELAETNLTGEPSEENAAEALLFIKDVLQVLRQHS